MILDLKCSQIAHRVIFYKIQIRLVLDQRELTTSENRCPIFISYIRVSISLSLS